MNRRDMLNTATCQTQQLIVAKQFLHKGAVTESICLTRCYLLLYSKVSRVRIAGQRLHTLSISSVRRFLTDLCILSRSEVRCVLSGPSVLTLLMIPIKKAPLLLTRRKSLLPKLSTADSASASDSSAALASHQTSPHGDWQASCPPLHMQLSR